MTIKIALLGDQSDEVIAHRAIPPALQLAARQLSVECSSEWIHTTKINQSNLSMPLINAMFCSLREKPGQIRFKKPSRLHSIYQNDLVEEQYNCGFGVNKEYLHLFDDSDLFFTGFDNDHDPRAFELNNHPFFIGTAYQPERSALKKQNHPLITSFVKAAFEHSSVKLRSASRLCCPAKIFTDSVWNLGTSTVSKKIIY